ncbi:MAG: hypothetical protein K5650_00150 [Bacteroidales bacterium]|nr:hypothetical protein [Bacteroidales bacterium]
MTDKVKFKLGRPERLSDDRLILLMFAVLAVIPLFNGLVLLTEPGGLHSPYYFVGYSTGFGARKLLGTLFTVLLPDYATHKHLVPYIWGALLMVFLLFAFYFSRTFKGTNLSSNRNALPFFLATTVYLASSYSLLSCYTLVWYADIWLYLLTLVFISLFARFRSKGLWPVAYGVIVLTACLVHHIFCCLFFPLFVALFIHEILDGDKLVVKNLLAYGGIIAAVGALFVCLWSFSSMNIGFEELSSELKQRADDVCDSNPWLLNLLYGSSADNYHTMWTEGQFPTRYYQFPFLLLLLSPLIAIFVSPWIMCVRHAKNRVRKAKYLLMLCVPTVMFLPVFAVATDYGRWMMAWFFCQALLLLTMYRIGDVHIIAAMRTLFNWCRHHMVVAILLVAYILLLRLTPNDNSGVNVLSFAARLLAP